MSIKLTKLVIWEMPSEIIENFLVSKKKENAETLELKIKDEEANNSYLYGILSLAIGAVGAGYLFAKSNQSKSKKEKPITAPQREPDKILESQSNQEGSQSKKSPKKRKPKPKSAITKTKDEKIESDPIVEEIDLKPEEKSEDSNGNDSPQTSSSPVEISEIDVKNKYKDYVISGDLQKNIDKIEIGLGFAEYKYTGTDIQSDYYQEYIEFNKVEEFKGKELSFSLKAHFHQKLDKFIKKISEKLNEDQKFKIREKEIKSMVYMILDYACGDNYAVRHHMDFLNKLSKENFVDGSGHAKKSSSNLNTLKLCKIINILNRNVDSVDKILRFANQLRSEIMPENPSKIHYLRNFKPDSQKKDSVKLGS